MWWCKYPSPQPSQVHHFAHFSYSVSNLPCKITRSSSLFGTNQWSRHRTPKSPKSLWGLSANAMKRKDSFVQLFAMTGILLLSMRSLGQKYRIHDLQEDTLTLREEQETIKERMNTIKRSLLDEAALDPTGQFAARLGLLFGGQDE